MAHNNASDRSAKSKLILIKKNGFTLVELLVVSLLGAFVTISAAQILIGHIRVSVTAEAMLRAQDTWSRVQFLLDQEIQEAETIAANGSTLTLTLPAVEGVSDQIIYTLNGTDLIRTGPNISPSDGSLILGTSNTNVLAGNVSEFTPETNASGRTITYELNLQDPSGFTFKEAKTTGSHTRTRIL